MTSKCEDYDFVGSYDNQRITTINAERSVNLFEYMDANGKRPKALISTSGLVNSGLTFTPETGGSRATFVFNNSIYQVFGSSVFLITGAIGSLTKSLLGTLVTTTGYVGIDANQYQVIFVDGVEGYIWDINATTFLQITDVGFPANPIDVCYLDGYFLVAAGGTNNFYLSLINNGMVWSGGTATFTGSSSTNILTLSTSNANFATGVPVTLTLGTGNSTFTANTSGSLITLTTSNASFQTAVPITFKPTVASATFTADTVANTLTLSSNATNFQTGAALTFSTTGSLPAPLNSATTYYAILVGTTTSLPGTIKVATTYANAIAGTAITLTTNGTPTCVVNSTSSLPAPLTAGTTYYSIAVSSSTTVPGTIQVATSASNASAGTFITLTTNGSPVSTVNSVGILPKPLNTTTTYYAILVGSSSTNPGTIKLATSYANAIAGTFITLTDNGTSANTITVAGQLQFGSITSHPGTIVACRTLHRRIFLFSQYYTEVWENAGQGTNLPFRRNNSLLMEVGTPALGSVAVGFDRMFFLSQDRDGLSGVMEVKGTESLLVSNKALDYQLAQYAAGAGVSDARGILIKENGLIFYRLNFTASNHTFVLNVSMSTADSPKWHEEEVINGNRHPAQTHAYYAGVNFYGDYQSSLFYIVSDQVTTNNGERIRRMRIGRQMSPEGYKRLRIDRWHLDLLQGSLATGPLGFTSDPGLNNIFIVPYELNAEPTVYLSVSKDGGQSFGNSLHSTMGEIGQRTHRTIWRKLGTTPRGQGFVPKVEFFSEIPFIILGAAWNYEILPE